MRRLMTVLAVAALAGVLAVPTVALASGPKLKLTVTGGPPTTATKAKGSAYPAGDAITVTFDSTTVASATTSATGTFAAPFAVPASAVPGPHTVSAFDVLGLGASAPFLVRTDWTSSRFDSKGSGFNPYENVLSPANVGGLMYTQAPAWAGFLHSAPIYAGGKLFAGSDDGTVRALDPLTGNQIWSTNIGGAVLGSPLALKTTKAPGPTGFCAIVAGSGDGSLIGLDPSTGAQLWGTAIGTGAVGTPVLVNPGPGQRVVVQAADGTVAELDGCTGTPVWMNPARNPGPTGTPAVLGGVKLADGSTRTIIVVCFNDGTVQALDAVTGAILWSQRNPGPGGSPAGYGSGSGARVVFGSGASGVELNAGTGHQMWSFITGGTVNGAVGLYSVPAVMTKEAPALKLSLHAVIAGDSAGNLYALNPKTGAALWSERAPGPVGSPAIANGVVYLTTEPSPAAGGMLVARNAGDGSVLFQGTLGSSAPPDPIHGPSPAVADGMVFTGNFTGGLSVFIQPCI